MLPAEYCKASNGVIVTRDEHVSGTFWDDDGNMYEECWCCEGIFPSNEMIVGNVDGIYCFECDEEMTLDSEYDAW